jgi:5-methylthioadenosine/S-adenosylhomocysteine deaminase
MLTMVDGEEPFEGWMTVGTDGLVLEVGAGACPAPEGEVLDASGKIVAPGFVSAHSHLHTSGLRGIASDQALYPWVRACVEVTMGADPEDMYWFALHGCLDFLANGITTAFNFGQNEVLSHYDPARGASVVVRKPETFLTRQFDAIADSGLRAMAAIRLDDEIGNRPGSGPSDAEVLDRFAHLSAEFQRRVPARQSFGTAVYGGVQWASCRRTAVLEAETMKRHGVINQAHFLETTEDLEGQRHKFAWYSDAGVLGPHMLFGHFLHPTDEIVAAVADSGTGMVWQPTSNGRLGSGVADVVRYRNAGIPLAVGLDDQSCTDISDPFANMRLGLYSQRTLCTDPSVMTVREMLRLHTLGSAETLGISDRVGSIAPGKHADFLLVDVTSPDVGPIWDLYATYVLACGLRNLTEVRVGGVAVWRSGASLHPRATEAKHELHSRVIVSAKRRGIPAPISAMPRRFNRTEHFERLEKISN